MFRSGLIALDDALFAGTGCPPGSLIEIHGNEDSGKTSLALWFCRTYQEQTQLSVAWVSTEMILRKRNLRWAGVDPENTLIINQSLDMPGLMALQHCLAEGIKVVVLDSIAALIDQDLETPLAQVLSAQLYKVKELAQKGEALVIFTNQERTRLPGQGMTRSGASPALNRLVDCQIRLQSGQGLYRGGIQEGMRVYFRITKNGSDFSQWNRAGRFNVVYNTGLKDVRRKEAQDVAA